VGGDVEVSEQDASVAPPSFVVEVVPPDAVPVMFKRLAGVSQARARD
jgi:hypothetical protein